MGDYLTSSVGYYSFKKIKAYNEQSKVLLRRTQLRYLLTQGEEMFKGRLDKCMEQRMIIVQSQYFTRLCDADQ